MMASGHHVWLYAVTDSAAGWPARNLTGVGGQAVRSVRAAELTAIVSDVAELEFGADALRRNLENLRWLETVAREHHAVIEAAADQGPVVPMRLATVYESDAGLVGTLEERAADLHRALSRVRACHEWGVQGYVMEAAAGPAAAGDAASASGEEPAGPGAAYLQRRRAQLQERESLSRHAAASAQAAYAELSRFSVGSRLYPPQAPELSGQSASMVLNAAYLVPDDRSDEFRTAVTALARRHSSLQLVLTGPWPAYSFVGEAKAGEPQ